MKKVFWLVAALALVLAPKLALAALPDSGWNPVNTDKCMQVGKDIQVENFGNTYLLTSECRDAGNGLKQYTMSCLSDKQYRVDWKPCSADDLKKVTPNCSDTDNGIDYGVSGNTTGPTEISDTVQTQSDTCGDFVGDSGKASGSFVLERHCSVGRIHNQWYKCEYGCSAGACQAKPVPAPVAKCSETDGLSYDVYGTASGNDEVTGQNGEYGDSCGAYVGDKGKTSGDYIAETHCSAGNGKNYVHTQWYKCANGCVSGVCQPKKLDVAPSYDLNAKTTITSPLNNTVFTNFPRIANINWQEVKSSNNYLVEVGCDKCGVGAPWSDTYKWKAYSNSFTTQPLSGDNQFRTRVLPMYPNGTSGQWSDYTYFSFNTASNNNQTSPVSSLPVCSDITGGNVNFIVCTGYAVDHFWSGTKVKILDHDGETASVELVGLSETDADLVINEPETFYVNNKPGKYLVVTYLGVGAEGRALVKVDSNTTYQDSFGDSCTNEQGGNGVYTVCKNNWFTFDGTAFKFQVVKYNNNYVWLKLNGAKSTNVVLKINAKKKYSLKQSGAYVELTYQGNSGKGGAKVKVNLVSP